MQSFLFHSQKKIKQLQHLEIPFLKSAFADILQVEKIWELASPLLITHSRIQYTQMQTFQVIKNILIENVSKKFKTLYLTSKFSSFIRISNEIVANLYSTYIWNSNKYMKAYIF